jgi:hypothetical protein
MDIRTVFPYTHTTVNNLKRLFFKKVVQLVHRGICCLNAPATVSSPPEAISCHPYRKRLIFDRLTELAAIMLVNLVYFCVFC